MTRPMKSQRRSWRGAGILALIAVSLAAAALIRAQDAKTVPAKNQEKTTPAVEKTASPAAPAERTAGTGPFTDSTDRKRFEDLVDLYVYAFPAVVLDQMQREMTDSFFFAPVNKMAYQTVLPSPAMKWSECPNVDSLLATAWLDLTNGPQILVLPETANHHYYLELLDGWSNVVGNVNDRDAESIPVVTLDKRNVRAIAVVGPGNKAPLPEGIKTIVSPTARVWTIVRVLLGSPHSEKDLNLPAVCRTLYEFEVLSPAEWERERKAGEKPAETSASGWSNKESGNILETGPAVRSAWPFALAATARSFREQFLTLRNLDDPMDAPSEGSEGTAGAKTTEFTLEVEENDETVDPDDGPDDGPDAEEDGDADDQEGDVGVKKEEKNKEKDALRKDCREKKSEGTPAADSPMKKEMDEKKSEENEAMTPTGEREKTDIEKPDVKKPDAEKPDVKKPDAEKPDVKKPDVKKPGAAASTWEYHRTPWRRGGVIVQKAVYQKDGEKKSDDKAAEQTTEKSDSGKPTPAPTQTPTQDDSAVGVVEETAVIETVPPSSEDGALKNAKEKIEKAGERVKTDTEDATKKIERDAADAEREAADAGREMDRLEREVSDFFARSWRRSRELAQGAVETGETTAEYFDRRFKRDAHRMARDFAPLVGRDFWKFYPLHRVETMTGEEFFIRFAELLKTNPPAAADSAMVEKIKSVGIVPGESFDVKKESPTTRHLLRFAAPFARLKIEQAALAGKYQKSGSTGWTVLDKLGNYGTDYLCRAVIAEKFIGADVPKAVLYPFVLKDATGEALSGKNSYRLHFDAGNLPPTDIFWSITLYDANFELVSNSLRRYSVRSNQPLVYGEDESLDVTISREPPKEKISNWLPAPEGDFILMMRIYSPAPSALDGSWSIPAVEKTGSESKK